MNDELIPIEGEHRGVGLHSGQSKARLTVVRRDIDRAHALQDIEDLVPFADDPANAPEARLLARAKALAILDDAVERRAPRSRTATLSRERIKASAAGCGSRRWQSRTHFASLLDPIGPSDVNRVPLRAAPLRASR